MTEPASEALARPGGLPAAVWMTGCAAMMACAALAAKALGRGVGTGLPAGTDAATEAALHPFQVSFARFLFALLAVALIAAWRRPPLRRVPWRLHGARTLCGWLGATALFAAAAAMPLAEATAISFLNPVMTMLFAIPLLGERIGPWRWTGTALAFVGALLLVQPGAAAFQPAALIALAAAVLFGLEAIAIKRLTGLQPVLAILLINNLLGLALASTAAAAVWRAPTPAQWALMAAVGLSVVAAQTCFLQANARAEASAVAPFFYLTLVFAAGFDLALFGDLPDPLATVGAGVVVAAALLIAWRERARGPQPPAGPAGHPR
ncbi:MAG: DMT family transporter [Pseudomonadota bacterium]